MAAVAIRGTTYPVVLPKLRDPRLHLAATITSLQVLGQAAFNFRLSIAQILMCLGTVALIEIAITAWRQHVLMWPASALLTGNGVAFVLRVPGTRHGDWWSTHGWWIFVATAAGSLLSKYVIAWKGEHVFNPSNIGLVVVFLALGRSRVEPLDFWWGPMSWWMVLALAIIVSGGFAILSRLKLLRVALSFWAAFAIGIGFLALGGHAMTARWHLGPIQGFQFWWILVTSPEVLVFLFFMITDPKTAPREARARSVYGLALGFLAAALIAPTTTEFAAKVALLSSLAVVCVAKRVPLHVGRRWAVSFVTAGAVAFAVVTAFANNGLAHVAPVVLPPGTLPAIAIDPSPGVQTQLDRKTADLIAYALVAAHRVHLGDTVREHLVPGTDQSPPTAVVQLAATTFHLSQGSDGAWTLIGAPPASKPQAVLASRSLTGTRLTNVAASVGLNFTQGAFSSGVTNETKAMMGGGVCWLDYNHDGWLDLFAVNSFASTDAAQPASQLFENVHGQFRNVTRQTHAGLDVQGDGCAAGDLNGDGRMDLVVSTTSGVDVLWNDGGAFREQALPAPFGWYTGVAIADVNGDGRPDIFVAGYADPNEPVPGSLAGFPTNLEGVRDLLFLNDGGGHFREVGAQAGLEAANFRHGLGAEFIDVNHDGRPDLYVANDEDPNDLYVNVPWPGGAAADPYHLGFRFEERGAAEHVDDPFAGMGVAFDGANLIVTNSRGEASAAFRVTPNGFANARPQIDQALGTSFAGWGASWVDLANSGKPDLVLTAGAIPVTNLRTDAEAMRVLAPAQNGYGVSAGVLPTLSLNGRGLAAADAFNDGRMAVAVNTIGGKLVLLRPSGPSGHWLDVALSSFVPGAVVIADGTQRQVQAGSSYLSSEDPRVHFGLGARAVVRRVVVRYPWGAQTVLHDVRADRIITVAVPPFVPAAAASTRTCVPRADAARSWDMEAARVVADGNAPDPVQARDLYLSSLAAARAFPAGRKAIAYAEYRLLVWLSSYDSNLQQTFAELTDAFCYDPSVTTTTGDSPAAFGNRVAAQLIAASLRDGSHEALHYADPSFAAQNAPLVVQQAGSTVHDATFWQPLSFGRSRVQQFVGSQWGGVLTYAGRVHVAAPALGDPSGSAYRDAAIAAIRATAAPGAVAPERSPAGWNADLPSLGLARDVRFDLALNGALNDAAVSVFGAKRAYDAPRPISMIRYLAFNNQLPIVSGLTRRSGNVTEVLLRGRWVRGDTWAPPALTPPSPGYPSANAAFAAAAGAVLHRADAQAGRAGIANGTELAADVAAGTKIGLAAGRAALARR